jgi:hypothetical protein
LKWFPIVSALSRVAIESESLSTRTRAIEAMFETNKNGSHLFAFNYWKAIVKNAISPVFSDLVERYENSGDVSDNTNSKDGSTALWIQTLRFAVDTFTESFETISEGNGELITNLLDWILFMIGQRDEKVSPISIFKCV